MSYYSIQEKARAEIENRRNTARAEADYRSEIIRSMSEEVAEIDEELSKTGMLIFKTACSGGDIAPIKERNKQLQHRRREIIISLGYPEDYTDVKYSCTDCSDSGYIDGVKTCHCLKELIIKERIAASAMGNLIEKQSFDSFSLKCYDYDEKVLERMTAILAMAKNYVKNFSKRKDNLLLIGPTGTGKTHISTAIARELIHEGYDVIYDSTQNILSDFEDDKFRGGWNSENRSDKYLECTLLIIDDLGTEMPSQFVTAALYALVNDRLLAGKAMIISTNLNTEDMTRRYNPQIASRLRGSFTRVAFLGDDIRVKKNWGM